MNIASLTVPAALAPLHSFFRWLGVPQQRSPARYSAPAMPTGRVVAPPAFLRQRVAFKPLAACRTLPVVRVIRMLESGQSRSSVGRMVISGRMADVCAELDRLVSREETIH
jgi:hypothetical protein